MAKNNENLDGIQKADFPAGPSYEELLKMLADSQKANAEALKEMASALLESRKPYVDPKVLEQKAQALEERRKQILNEQRAKVATKRNCPHIREVNGTPNIKWMQHSNGIVLGVCGTCFSQFDATRNAEDRELFRKDLKSMRNMGRAGEHAKRTEIAYA